MPQALKVLIVEDNEDDAELLLRELRRGGFEPHHERVETEETLRDALARGSWELIVCDHAMPRLDSFAALEIMRECGLDLPFIVVSGTIGEEVAVKTMKAGAHDYLMKDNLARLVPAIERELREAGERRRKRRAEQALEEAHRELENRVRERTDELAAANDALQATTRTLRTLIGASPVAIVVLDLEGRVTMWNPAAEAIFGWSESEVLGKPYLPVPESARAAFEREIETAIDGKSFFNLEVTRRRKNGELFQASLASAPLRDEAGEVVGSVGLLSDISERKRAEEALQASEARVRAIVDTVIDGLITIDDRGTVQAFNPGAEKVFGFSADEIVGRNVKILVPEPDHGRHDSYIGNYLQTGAAKIIGIGREVTGRRKDGTEFPIDLAINEMRVGGRRMFVASCRDISQRKRAEEALRQARDELEQRVEERTAELRASERILATAQEIAGLGSWERDLVHDELTWSDELYRILGFEPGCRQPDYEFFVSCLHPDDRPAEKEMHGQALETGGYDIESRIVLPDGDVRYVHRRAEIIRDEDENPIRIGGTVHDVTERRQAEDALRESRDQLRLITDNLPVLITYTDVERRFRFVNKVCETWYGRESEEIIGRRFEEIFGEAAYRKLLPRIEIALSGEAVSFEESIEYPDGRVRDVEVSYIADVGPNGRVRGYFGLVIDISERKAIEEQLRQAQKMEAVGQLTGGIAHDFNNLLTVIFGNLELLKDELDGAERARAYADAALLAADRGAGLTDRLLAFSRQQTLEPKAIDLEELIGDAVELMKRALGAEIDIEVDLAGGIWRPRADPNQLENALINLAVNARDAMPAGGTLAIAASNETFEPDPADAHAEVAPGDYVVIAVRDTGSGIAPEILERVFDPFFTTKGVGEGSGLGLSMVYGFAKQSGGHVRIESEPGRGTTVQLYLPRSEAGDPLSGTVELSDGETPGGGETLLLVEDDGAVRSFTAYVLEALGYRVLEVADGPEAVSVLEATPNIDLVITDVVLPRGMNGRDVAAVVRQRFPEVRVMYTSGYADRAFEREEIQKGDIELLAKPYTKDTLGRRVREVLDGAGPPSARPG